MSAGLPSSVREKYVDAIRNAYPPAEFSPFLLNKLSWRLEDIAPANATHKKQVDLVVRFAEAEGDCARLLKFAIEDRPNNLDLQAVWSELTEATGSLTGSHFDTCLLLGSTPFVNRADLRREVELLRDGNRRILTVVGESKTGRTFSADFVHHLATCFTDVNAIEINLKRFVGRSIDDLFRRIVVDKLRKTETSTVDRGDDAGAKLCGHIREETEDGALWLILDNCDAPGLFEEIRPFIDYLAEEAVQLPNFRLLLLAYDERIPPRAHGIVSREQISLPSEDDIKHFLQMFFECKNLGELDDVTAAQEAKSILDQVGPEDEFMPTLKLAIDTWIEVKLEDE